MQNIQSASNTTDPALCPVRAMLRIRDCAIRVHPFSSALIGVAKDNDQLIYLHEPAVNAHIRTAATAVYDITDVAELQRFSSHSARVGAAVHFHLSGKDASFIKT